MCPYCRSWANLVTGKEIYPHRPDLFDKKFWECAPCGAYVGCHPGGIKPLGRLANASLRVTKQRAHAAFDPLWKDGGMTRSEAYARLSEDLEIPREECHIGMFDEFRCQRVIIWAQNVWNKA
ncbi:zinc-finger-containing protein [Castellaniella sp.]|uniref:zinc-finger-containing protein n=1 Tax=Castellaniella sp. TaxID=1955812 RepID=UPI002AFF30CB|nr:zinc-finger-containing protein [Castellaniella sp.]